MSKTIGWVVAVVAGLIAFSVAKNLVSGGFAKPDWQTRTVAGVTLESPVKFSPSQENIPADVKRMTESFETHEGKLGRDSFHVGVMQSATRRASR